VWKFVLLGPSRGPIDLSFPGFRRDYFRTK